MHLLLLAQAIHTFLGMVWGCKQVGSSGMCFLLFEVFHFTLNGTCCQHRATSSISSTLLSLAVNKTSVLRGGGTHQPLKVELRDRLTGHKTKQFASHGGSGVVKRNVFFHTFLFIPAIKFSPCQQKCSSSSKCVGAELSLAGFNQCFLDVLHEGVEEKQCFSGSGLYTSSPLMVASQMHYLFQAGTWHPKKNPLVDAASDLGVESTVKLSAQDRQWCHSLERKHTAKATPFPL